MGIDGSTVRTAASTVSSGTAIDGSFIANP
jgi:hypothetical protein